MSGTGFFQHSRMENVRSNLLLLFPLLALVVPKMASALFALFVIAGLVQVLRHRSLQPISGYTLILVSFASYFLVGVITYFIGDGSKLGWSILTRDARFAVAVLSCFAVVAASSGARSRANVLLCSGIVIGLFAAIQVGISDTVVRASGATISILFGHLVAALFLASIPFALQRGRSLFAWSGVTGAFLALILSGTRGALLPVLLLLPFMLLMAASAFRKRALLIGIVLLTAFAVSILSERMYLRVMDGFSEVQKDSLTQHIELEPTEGSWVCVDSPSSLQSLISSGERGGKGKLDIEIVRDTSTEAFGCNNGFAIRLENVSDENACFTCPPAAFLLTPHQGCCWLEERPRSA